MCALERCCNLDAATVEKLISDLAPERLDLFDIARNNDAEYSLYIGNSFYYVCTEHEGVPSARLLEIGYDVVQRYELG